MNILRSIAPAFLGGGSLFGYLQRAPSQPSGRLRLMRGFHAELAEWRDLVANLGSLLTQLLEVVLPAPTCHGTHHACQWGLEGGGCMSIVNACAYGTCLLILCGAWTLPLTARETTSWVILSLQWQAHRSPSWRPICPQ